MSIMDRFRRKLAGSLTERDRLELEAERIGRIKRGFVRQAHGFGERFEVRVHRRRGRRSRKGRRRWRRRHDRLAWHGPAPPEEVFR